MPEDLTNNAEEIGGVYVTIGVNTDALRAAPAETKGVLKTIEAQTASVKIVADTTQLRAIDTSKMIVAPPAMRISVDTRQAAASIAGFLADAQKQVASLRIITSHQAVVTSSGVVQVPQTDFRKMWDTQREGLRELRIGNAVEAGGLQGASVGYRRRQIRC